MQRLYSNPYPFVYEQKEAQMNTVKWFTQRITGLIFWPTVVLGTPFVLTKIGQTLGLWSSIDTVYTTMPWLFWVLLVLTRALFAAAWIFIGIGLHRIGKDWGFFWFEEERNYYSSKSDPIDQSGYIIGISMAIFIVLFVAEFAIRVVTSTNPPYLPPPVS